MSPPDSCQLCGNLGARRVGFMLRVTLDGVHAEAWEESTVRLCLECIGVDGRDATQNVARLLREAWSGPLG